VKPDPFVLAAALEDVPEGAAKRVVAGGRPVLLCRVEGRVYALEDLCTHEFGPLGAGRVVGHAIECPYHGARFDVRTGEAVRLPAAAPIRTFPVRVDGDRVYVLLDGPVDTREDPCGTRRIPPCKP
jgi:3-phenylpropionate/trans-cinnamate dioxygenase ferredoxin subunit